jgi:hypothetical protein
MTIKPFAIQGADLTLGGVSLQAGTTGVVIPGVTRATNYVPEQVEDTGDQTVSWGRYAPIVIDYTRFSILNADYTAPVGYGAATYYVDSLDEEGYIDGGIDITDPGAGWDSVAANGTKNNDMRAATQFRVILDLNETGRVGETMVSGTTYAFPAWLQSFNMVGWKVYINGVDTGQTVTDQDNTMNNGNTTGLMFSDTINVSVDAWAFSPAGYPFGGVDYPWNPGDWEPIPFRVKIRAGEIETIGGGGGSSITNEGETLSIRNDGEIVLDGPEGGIDRGIRWKYGADNNGYDSFIRQDEAGFTIQSYADDLNADGTNIVLRTGDSNSIWKFKPTGGLEFPDGTTQTTAYTGQSGGTATALYITANTDGNITTSADGVTWSDPFSTGINIGTVAIGPGKIIFTRSDVNNDNSATGLYITTSPTIQPILLTGTDSNMGGEYYWKQVQYFEGTAYPWVAVGKRVEPGSGRAYPVITYSADTVTWAWWDPDQTVTSAYADQGSDLEFTDIAYGEGYYLISAIGSTIPGGLWVINGPLNSGSSLAMSNQLADVIDNFKTVEYFGSGGETWSRWAGFNTNAGLWNTYNADPTVANWSQWGPTSIADNIFNETGLTNQSVEETTAGFAGGYWIWMTSSSNGHVVWWPNVPAGPFVSIPNPYTSTVLDIIRNAPGDGLPTIIVTTGPYNRLQDGEKVTISGVTSATEGGSTTEQSYNISCYVKYQSDNHFEAYTDQACTTPWDTSTFWPIDNTTGILTWSHGQYLDALGFANGYFFVGNDDEQIFKGTFNGQGQLSLTWTKVDDKNDSLMYWNDFAYNANFATSSSSTLNAKVIDTMFGAVVYAPSDTELWISGTTVEAMPAGTKFYFTGNPTEWTVDTVGTIYSFVQVTVTGTGWQGGPYPQNTGFVYSMLTSPVGTIISEPGITMSVNSTTLAIGLDATLPDNGIAKVNGQNCDPGATTPNTFTVNVTDELYAVSQNGSSQQAQVMLPTNPPLGKVYTIKFFEKNNPANCIILAPEGTSIDGNPIVAINKNNGYVTVVWDSGWSLYRIVSKDTEETIQANTYVDGTIELNVNAKVNKLVPQASSGGSQYHLADGYEGQVMHIVAATGGEQISEYTSMSFDHARWSNNTSSTPGVINEGLNVSWWLPFRGGATALTLVFADGSWNLPHSIFD